MDFEDEPGYDVEWASAQGLTLLDELRVSMVECLLVVESLAGNVDLNLDDLTAELQAVQRSAQQAYKAASLLNQRATLETAWTANLSRPKAVLARHSAAVRNGAPQMSPIAPHTERIENLLWNRPPADRPDEVNSQRAVRRALGIGISADWLRRRQDMSRWYHEAETIAGVS